MKNNDYLIIDDSILVENVTLCVGRNFLEMVIDKFTDDSDEYYQRLNDFISSLNNYRYVDKFEILYPEVFDVMFDEVEELASKLNWYATDEMYFHWYLIKHIENILPKFEEDIRRGITHNFLEILPYRIYHSNVVRDEDSELEANNILCKLKTKNYLKHTERNEDGAGAWTYQLCILYIILIEGMYRILEHLVSNKIEKFLVEFLSIIHPIIIGFTATVSYQLEGMDTVEVMHELMQLTTHGKHLLITKNPSVPSITFTYRTLEGNFLNISNIEGTYKPVYYKSDYRNDKTGKRYAYVKVYGSKNTLKLRLTFIGLGILDEITDLVANSTLFSLLYDEVTLFEYGYKTLATMLKHTSEAGSKLNTIMPDMTNRAIQYLIEKYKLKENAVSYCIVANELASMSSDRAASVIDIHFKPTDTKQKTLINKMIADVRRIKRLDNNPVLKYLYKTFNHSVGVD